MPSTGPRISPRNCAALQAAEAAGIEIVIATGRRQAYAMPLIAQVGLSEDSVMISSNGAVVRGFDGELLDRRFLPLETARQLCVALRGYQTMVFTFDREGAGAMVIENLQQLHARVAKWVEANRPYLVAVSYTHLDVYKRQLLFRLGGEVHFHAVQDTGKVRLGQTMLKRLASLVHWTFAAGAFSLHVYTD